MTPRLVLVDGPASADVCRVLRSGCPGAEPVTGGSCEPWWGEVREFRAASAHVFGLVRGAFMAIMRAKMDADNAPRHERPYIGITDFNDSLLISQVEAGICTLQDGLPFLMDQVLPRYDTVNPYARGAAKQAGLSVWAYYCKHYSCTTTRMAIDASWEAPTPLAERVHSWGGEHWKTGTGHDGTLYLIDTPRGLFDGSSWLEVTRKAAA